MKDQGTTINRIRIQFNSERKGSRRDGEDSAEYIARSGSMRAYETLGIQH